MRANATRARLPAFSISSRQSSTTSGLRRVSTPATPMQKMNAERTTNQATSISVPGPQSPVPRQPPPAACQDDRADRGYQEQVRGGLEGDQELAEQQLADLPPRAEARSDVGPAAVERAQARADDRDHEFDQ